MCVCVWKKTVCIEKCGNKDFRYLFPHRLFVFYFSTSACVLMFHFRQTPTFISMISFLRRVEKGTLPKWSECWRNCFESKNSVFRLIFLLCSDFADIVAIFDVATFRIRLTSLLSSFVVFFFLFSIENVHRNHFFSWDERKRKKSLQRRFELNEEIKRQIHWHGGREV